MKKQNFTCVVFDLDGTLMYTLDDIAENVNNALIHFGFPTHRPEIIKTFINNGAFKLISRALPDKVKDNKEKVDEVLTYYNRIYAQNVAVHTKLYDGIYELIEDLKSLGITLVVASNKPLLHTRLLCEKFFPAGTFSYIFGTGDNRPVKPSKQVIDTILEAVKKQENEVLYVGDSVVDVKTAKNSSLFCCGVLWGFKGKDSFTEEQPDVTVNSPSEILDLFSV